MRGKLNQAQFPNDAGIRFTSCNMDWPTASRLARATPYWSLHTCPMPAEAEAGRSGELSE